MSVCGLNIRKGFNNPVPLSPLAGACMNLSYQFQFLSFGNAALMLVDTKKQTQSIHYFICLLSDHETQCFINETAPLALYRLLQKQSFHK